MTSRTNSHLGDQNLRGTDEVTPSNLEQRHQLAVQRYLDGDLIETICHEMGCSKSWLYKWKKRYQATEPTWAQEHSRRPETTPTKTPEGIESAIIQLRQTLSPDGAEMVSARVIQAHLPVTGVGPQLGGVHATTDARFRVAAGGGQHSCHPLHGRPEACTGHA